MTRQRMGPSVVAVVALVTLITGIGMTTPAGADGGAGPGAWVRLAGPTPVLPSGASVLGPTDGSASLTADVSLKPRDQPALDAFVHAVSTPGSQQYHRFLAARQF